MNKKTRWLVASEAELLGLKIRKNEGKRKNARYYINQEQWELVLSERGGNAEPKPKPKKVKKRKQKEKEIPFDLSAWTKDGKIMDIDEFCSTHNLNRGDISTWRLCTHTKVPTYNISFKENKEVSNVVNYDFIEELVKKHINPVSIEEKGCEQSKTFDRLVYSDVHIGMTTNKNGYALYGQKWDEEELNERRKEVEDFINENKESSSLYLDELGDYLDGWDGETTRKGHKLPQNMDNQKAFDVAVSFKVELIDFLINIYDEIVMNNICEDNHAGSFGYVVNSAVKSILEIKYPKKVKVINHRKFINHYYVGKHAFLISHGKDSKNLKFGFKPHLDPKQVEKIDQYCKINDVYKNSSFVEFSKGDSHQSIMDYATSDDFDYCNYPAFSPSSEWVQTNFKRGRSGFVFYTIDRYSDIKKKTNYWFDKNFD